MTRYIVATIKPWNISAFHRQAASLPGNWHLVQRREDLTPALIEKRRPRYVFFPHWSWRVPAGILDAAECVCFHMTDLPYGRGGSPLQNLIVRGHRETMVSALRMVDKLDAGPIYLKAPLSLEGRAQEIYERTADLVFEMMRKIAETNPEAAPQSGDIVTFDRRTPDQSVLPKAGTLDMLHDHIRMLDAEDYPQAFLRHGKFRIEFTQSELIDGALHAHVTIRCDE